MSATDHADIRAALTVHLKGQLGLPQIAWENRSFAPVPLQPYLEPEVLPGEPRQASQGADSPNWHVGVYQIFIKNYPRDRGIGELNELAGVILDRFKRGTVLQSNGVTVTIQKAFPGPVDRSDPSGLKLPLTIRFTALAPN